MQKNLTDRPLSPEDHIKHDLVKLRGSTGDHYSKSYNNPKERFAFCKKTRIFITSLEPYTDKTIIQDTMNHYNELFGKIKEIKDNKRLDDKTKEANILRLEFEYSEPVYFMGLRIFHHSHIVEMEAQAVLKSRDKDIKDRVRGYKNKIDMVLERIVEVNDEGF